MNDSPFGAPPPRADIPQQRVIPNVFLAHPKDHPLISVLRVEVETALGGVDHVRVVPGEDDWNANFKTSGGWIGWENSVVTGQERLLDGRIVPRFSLIVVSPNLEIGKVTASICRKALQISKQVLYWDRRQFSRASTVRTVNPRDMKTGWILT